MARWRLTASHYLNVPDSRWEYSEISRSTGKPVRQQFIVPALLDINDPGDWTEKSLGVDGKPLDGAIIVCHQGKGQPTDRVFFGDPTPDMEPLDDEAKALSKARSVNWTHPIDSLPGQGYTDSIIAGFQKQIADLQSGAIAQPASVSGVSKEEFTALQAQMAELMKQNTALIQQLVGGRRA